MARSSSTLLLAAAAAAALAGSARADVPADLVAQVPGFEKHSGFKVRTPSSRNRNDRGRPLARLTRRLAALFSPPPSLRTAAAAAAPAGCQGGGTPAGSPSSALWAARDHAADRQERCPQRSTPATCTSPARSPATTRWPSTTSSTPRSAGARSRLPRLCRAAVPAAAAAASASRLPGLILLRHPPWRGPCSSRSMQLLLLHLSACPAVCSAACCHNSSGLLWHAAPPCAPSRAPSGAYLKHRYYLTTRIRRSPSKDPLVTWHQGGPGGSSLYGAYTEMGCARRRLPFPLPPPAFHCRPLPSMLPLPSLAAPCRPLPFHCLCLSSSHCLSTAFLQTSRWTPTGRTPTTRCPPPPPHMNISAKSPAATMPMRRCTPRHTFHLKPVDWKSRSGEGGGRREGAGGRRSEGFPIFAPPQQTVINSWSEVRRGALRPVNTAV